jgi:SAM-dependent methyltransferase/uncharacterized protein YbaR (Trm112 family)
MRKALLDLLACPACFGALSLEARDEAEDGHILEGVLRCEGCGGSHAVEKGVPNMLPAGDALIEGEDLSGLQEATIDRFGYEWIHFKDWGWLEAYPDVPDAEERFFGGLVKNTVGAFWNKSQFTKDELGPGVRVLDGGCGNGRFVNQAGLTGAEAVGIDLGWGVYSAFDHTRHLPNVHIVRGDLFRLPFRDGTFDRVFSIGVLQHTGNGPKAFASLARTLKAGGLMSVTVYGTGRFAYEFIDRWLRVVTTRLSIRAQLSFARFTAGAARWLRRGGPLRKRLHRQVYSRINLLPTEHHMFDWWSAPVAHHYDVPEVASWFARANMTVVRSKPTAYPGGDDRGRRFGHGAISMLGVRAPESDG